MCDESLSTFSYHLDQVPQVWPRGNDHQRHEAVVSGAEDVLDHDEEEGAGEDGGGELGDQHGHSVGGDVDEEQHDGTHQVRLVLLILHQEASDL